NRCDGRASGGLPQSHRRTPGKPVPPQHCTDHDQLRTRPGTGAMSYVRSDSGSLSYWIGIPLLLLAALVEVSVLPFFRVFGLQPNLVLVILTAWVMVRGQDE